MCIEDGILTLVFGKHKKGNKGDFTYVEVYHFTGSGDHKLKMHFI